eukprot:2448313-Lingulodinium_polyedra.AAC.1
MRCGPGVVTSRGSSSRVTSTAIPPVERRARAFLCAEPSLTIAILDVLRYEDPTIPLSSWQPDSCWSAKGAPWFLKVA